ncbi:MAG TPA: hypothetical protein VL125_15205 [Pelobium sp.]|nr:hypothetical protein [Pelobium sp.]
MKTEKTIYIKCDERLLSKNNYYVILTASSLLICISLAFHFYQIITETSTYLILFTCSFPAFLSLYRLSAESSKHFILINNDEITFKQDKLDEEICLRFELIEYFETHFSKIVFSTKDQEKIILQLDKIANKQKRWEIKEFLRERIKQQKTVNHFAIA